MSPVLKSWIKFFAWLLLIPAVITAYFSPNIYGYYRFKAICAAEGGIRVQQILKKNVGWSVQSSGPDDAVYPMKFLPIAFFRYRNAKTGAFIDVYPAPKKQLSDDGFVESSADLSKPALYEWRYITQDLPSELRMNKSGYEIRDVQTGELLVRYYYFGYSTFDQNKTLLGAPSGNTCFNAPAPGGLFQPGELMTSLSQNAFNN